MARCENACSLNVFKIFATSPEDGRYMQEYDLTRAVGRI